ncbi:MAG: ADP-ribosylglycohydrolase family protein, partial [Proteobacteria bacterium]|nr:ADP-ribosylglycohydrolase family protein [Pseudomonadota bacterium]
MSMFARELFPPTPFPNSFWIEPGKLLAGEYPGVMDAAETRERLEALVEAGVSYFLNLTEPGELPSYDELLPQLRRDRAPSGQETPRLVHVRRPIEDHGLPDSHDVMRGILDDLERAIGEGHVVYVHCHAGIGRTNTVTGCWLRRQGLTGPLAMRRLNRLWQANARSQTWPRVPEFHQEQFVLAWTDSPDRAVKSPGRRRQRVHTPQSESSYLGAIFGAACGDALGSVVRGKKMGQFQALTGLKGGGPMNLPQGAWTDDTALMLCLAQSLLEKGDFDPSDQASLYWDWHQDGQYSATGQPLGKVSAISKALAATRWSGDPFSG